MEKVVTSLRTNFKGALYIKAKTWKEIWNQYFFNYFFFMPPRLAGGIKRSGCPYVRLSEDQIKIFVQGRISRSINGSKLIFHMSMYLYETSRNIQRAMASWPVFHSPLISDFGQIIKVKVFVQSRISRPINGSKFTISLEDVYLWDQQE